MSEHRPDPSKVASDPADAHNRLAIVAGYGPVGRMVARQLEQAGFELAIIELNLATIEKQLGLDKRVVYGDVRDRETLKKAGIERADALILAVPDEDMALMACRVAREIRPELFIAARTNFMSKGMLCQQAGADYVVVEEVVTAMAMRDAVMRRLVDEEERG